MITALWLMAAQGVIGAFDTLYYHEWRARLPARGGGASAELRLHAARDFLYAVLFGTLPWIAWQGRWALVLVLVLGAEIVFTLWDFVVEMRVRRPLGDVYGGERVTHAVMGIIYGSMLANLIPSLVTWLAMPTALAPASQAIPQALKWTLVSMAVGVLLSGLRDLYATFGLPFGSWPWKLAESAPRQVSS